MPVHPNKPWRLRLDTGGDFRSSHLDEIVGNGLGTAKSQHMLETALAVDPCHNIQFFWVRTSHKSLQSSECRIHYTFIPRNAVREGTTMQSTTQQIFSLDMPDTVCAFHCCPCLVPLKGGAGPLHSWSWCCGRSQSVSCSSELWKNYCCRASIALAQLAMLLSKVWAK